MKYTVYQAILFFLAVSRPPQDIDVLSVLDFQIPRLRPETAALHPRSFSTKHEGHERRLRRPRRL